MTCAATTVICLLAAVTSGDRSPSAASPSGRLNLLPREIVLNSASKAQQLAVHFLDVAQTMLDVTREAEILVADPAIARISKDGLLTGRASGETTLTVNWQDHSLAVPVKVSLETDHRPTSFRQEVIPILTKYGCNAGTCHGNLTGKGGFRLSLRGDDPGFDLASLTRDAFGRRINRIEPAASLVVKKPTGALPHEGGKRFSRFAEAQAILTRWIAEGVADDKESSPTIVRLEIEPKEAWIAAAGREIQILVTAHFADGSRRDVTRLAALDVSDPALARASTGGLIEATGPGQAAVAARFAGARATSRLAFLPDRAVDERRFPKSVHPIDAVVFARLKRLRIEPAVRIDDSGFLRRAHLTIIGTLPTAAEARQFLSSTAPDKHLSLVRRLIARSEFADFWALKWADVLRNEEKTMGAEGVVRLKDWLRKEIAADAPIDEFAARLLHSSGSTWLNPPASFFRTNRDAAAAAESLGQVFLGYRVQCAKCHNHPFDVWTQDDYYGLAAFFATVDRKILDNKRKDNLDSHEINGDVLISFRGKPEIAHPNRGEPAPAKALGEPPVGELSAEAALDSLARSVTRNRQFARNVANRVWYHLLGRGIVDPPDDFRDSNPPADPELLELLTDAFINGDYRLKPLVEFIATSTLFALDSRPGASDSHADGSFARYPDRLLSAEVIFDSIHHVLGTQSDLRVPGGRAVDLPGVRGGRMLKVFGKPDRLLTCECERSTATSLAQAFQILNGPEIRKALEEPNNRIAQLVASGLPAPAMIEQIYLAALCRLPTESELTAFVSHIEKAANKRRALEDVAWAILASKEFLIVR